MTMDVMQNKTAVVGSPQKQLTKSEKKAREKALKDEKKREREREKEREKALKEQKKLEKQREKSEEKKDKKNKKESSKKDSPSKRGTLSKHKVCSTTQQDVVTSNAGTFLPWDGSVKAKDIYLKGGQTASVETTVTTTSWMNVTTPGTSPSLTSTIGTKLSMVNSLGTSPSVTSGLGTSPSVTASLGTSPSMTSTLGLTPSVLSATGATSSSSSSTIASISAKETKVVKVSPKLGVTALGEAAGGRGHRSRGSSGASTPRLTPGFVGRTSSASPLLRTNCASNHYPRTGSPHGAWNHPANHIGGGPQQHSTPTNHLGTPTHRTHRLLPSCSSSGSLDAVVPRGPVPAAAAAAGRTPPRPSSRAASLSASPASSVHTQLSAAGLATDAHRPSPLPGTIPVLKANGSCKGIPNIPLTMGPSNAQRGPSRPTCRAERGAAAPRSQSCGAVAAGRAPRALPPDPTTFSPARHQLPTPTASPDKRTAAAGTSCLSCFSKKGHVGSIEDNRNLEEPAPCPAARPLVDNKQLVTELRAQNYDVIRFATYRTACKLRFLQKRTNLFLVDLWNVIEAFRENGLNSLEHTLEVPVARLESLLSSIYFHLNKRLPSSSQIDSEECITLLYGWLLSAFDPDGRGKVRVLSIKVSLSTMCSGKLMDKLRYVFTQVSDSSGFLVKSRFEEYLREVLALPTAVFEGPSFGYNETAARACFDLNKKVNVNDFLDTLISDPGPQCLMWLPILHRMATVENVFHPVQCEACHRESFMGFRYKCQRCYNYHLCQECFWRGRMSANHSNDHDVKEYSSYKSPAKELTHSLRKSFRCVPSKANHQIPRFPDEPEKTLDMSHIVPPTPPPVHNGFHDGSLTHHSLDVSSMDSSSATKSPSKLYGSLDSNRVDDEHRLIARYAARLAADTHNAARSPTELNYSMDSNKAQRELIAQLESKNRDILREIQRLRLEQEQQAAQAAAESAQSPRNPTLLAELRLLRQRRDELEARMAALQESRRELMVQLEGLMKLLKSHGSPRSTPNSSPRSRSAHSPPGGCILPPGRPPPAAPSTPGDSLAGVGGDVRQAFTAQTGAGGGSGTLGSVRSLRNDLLVAADSVTNAMSSLVKELNSEASSGSEGDDDDEKQGNQLVMDDFAAWQQEMQQRLVQESEFLRELRARKNSTSRHNSRCGSDSEPEQYFSKEDSEAFLRAEFDQFFTTDEGESYVKTDDESYNRTDEEDAELYDRDPKELIPNRYPTDEESCLETDQESYIRTDDEEGGNTDWEEAMRRWVNR